MQNDVISDDLPRNMYIEKISIFCHVRPWKAYLSSSRLSSADIGDLQTAITALRNKGMTKMTQIKKETLDKYENP